MRLDQGLLFFACGCLISPVPFTEITIFLYLTALIYKCIHIYGAFYIYIYTHTFTLYIMYIYTLYIYIYVKHIYLGLFVYFWVL